MRSQSYFWFLFLSLTTICKAINESSCGVSKTCIQIPKSCDSKAKDCVFFTFSYNSASESFKMELTGSTGAGKQYAAVGFTSVNKMENADTYFCTGNSLQTGVIRGQYSHPIIDNNLSKSITNVTAETVDGVASCTFTRAKTSPRTLSDGKKSDFDLTKESFYVIFAIGAWEGGEPQYHHEIFGINNGKVNFTTDNLVSQCSKTMGCFFSPDNCEPSTGNCKFFSWSYHPSENSFRFNIIGGSSSSKGYQAFGFSKTGKMEDSDVYYCTSFKVGVSTIGDLHDTPVDTTSVNISKVEYGVLNGAVKCSFTRPASIKNSIGVFDLVKDKYYLIHSTAGLSTDGKMLRHEDHSDRGRSASLIDFTEFSSSGGASVSLRFKLIQAHGVIMIIAWMVFSNIGVVIARHFKASWPNKTILDAKVWFQLHRFLMILVVVFTLLGIIIIFSAIKSWSRNSGSHPIIGLVVTLLAVINPLMALVRPAPNHSKRIYFNWGHWFVGSLARILSVAAIYLGLRLSILNLPTLTVWVMTAFVVNQVLAEVILEIISFIYGQNKDQQKSEESCLENSKFLLLVYIVITNVGFMITLAYYITK